MGSQFVDLNADGKIDLLTSTFDGSPHVSWGGEGGFGEPKHLLEPDGERVLVSYYWDYEKEQHLTTGRAFADGKERNQRGISSLAFDWDGDGDLDLLQGSYEEGRLYLQRNEGTREEARLTGLNEPVLAGGVPLENKDKMTAPRLVDWDGDGDMDLIYGTFGVQSYEEDEEAGGRIVLLVNQGKQGAPEFAAPVTLITGAIGTVAQSATAPTRGLYPEPVDWDGDGDLDLLVGGYASFTPPARELSAEEQAAVKDLQAERDSLDKEIEKRFDELAARVEAATQGKPEAEHEAISSKIYEEGLKEMREVQERLNKVQEELATLVPSKQEKPSVWLYERKGPQGA